MPLPVLLLASCGIAGSLRSTSDRVAVPEHGPTGIPPEMRARATTEDSTRVTPGGNLQNPKSIQLTPLEDLVFTGDAQSAEDVAELTKILASANSDPAWETSEAVARVRSVREGKPLLIWFTNSAKSPLCKVLERELFTDPQFEAWADEHLVRLKVDAVFVSRGTTMSFDEADEKAYAVKTQAEALKKRYRVLGFPALVVLKPGGETLGHIRGYNSGDAPLVWGRLKHMASIASQSYRQWRADLETKGYREWKNPAGRAIFAKLAHYHDGTVVLIDPEGTRFRTHESKLSQADQDWIAEQKQLRGIR
jgi:thioredoxin-related protein